MSGDKKLLERATYMVELMHGLKKKIDARVPTPLHQFKEDLTLPQMSVLGNIMQRGPISMRSLAQENMVAMSTMTEMVNRLVKLGFVKREKDESDRRIVNISMTPKGFKIFEEKFKMARASFVTLLSTMGSKKQQELISAFQTIERILAGPKK